MTQKYNKEFKINAVKVYLSNNKTIKQIAQDLGISRIFLIDKPTPRHKLYPLLFVKSTGYSGYSIGSPSQEKPTSLRLGIFVRITPE